MKKHKLKRQYLHTIMNKDFAHGALESLYEEGLEGEMLEAYSITLKEAEEAWQWLLKQI